MGTKTGSAADPARGAVVRSQAEEPYRRLIDPVDLVDRGMLWAALGSPVRSTPDLIGLSNDALGPYLQAVFLSEGGYQLIPPTSPKARHPRQVRIVPVSRDFH